MWKHCFILKQNVLCFHVVICNQTSSESREMVTINYKSPLLWFYKYMYHFVLFCIIVSVISSANHYSWFSRKCPNVVIYTQAGRQYDKSNPPLCLYEWGLITTCTWICTSEDSVQNGSVLVNLHVHVHTCIYMYIVSVSSAEHTFKFKSQNDDSHDILYGKLLSWVS